MTLELQATPISPKEPKDLAIEQSSLRPTPPFDRRKETRYATNDPVQIRLLNAGDGPQFSGTVLDVSRTGLRVEIPKPVGKGARLEVILPDGATIFGEARYCRHVSTRYHVGLAIEVVAYTQPRLTNHIRDKELSLYISGKGLAALEAIHLKNHLPTCTNCQERVTNARAVRPPGSGQTHTPRCER